MNIIDSNKRLHNLLDETRKDLHRSEDDLAEIRIKYINLTRDYTKLDEKRKDLILENSRIEGEKLLLIRQIKDLKYLHELETECDGIDADSIGKALVHGDYTGNCEG